MLKIKPFSHQRRLLTTPIQHSFESSSQFNKASERHKGHTYWKAKKNPKLSQCTDYMICIENLHYFQKKLLERRNELSNFAR